MKTTKDESSYHTCPNCGTEYEPMADSAEEAKTEMEKEQYRSKVCSGWCLNEYTSI